MGNTTYCAADVFVEEALKHVGEHANDWTWPTYGAGQIEWCAAFISSVAKTVGISGKCIFYTASATEHAKSGVAHHMGTYHKSHSHGGNYTPVKGDLIAFRNSSLISADIYYASHVGIVTRCEGTRVHTVEGNTGTYNKFTSIVKQKTYELSATRIIGYFHPDWSLVGSIDPSSTGSGNAITGDLYESSNTKKDMSVREVGYLDENFKPSIQASNIKLSVINYTGVLAAAFKLVAPVVPVYEGESNTDKLEGNCKVVIDFLISKGLNAAAACGIAGNIHHESGFRTEAVGDSGTSFGICQWHNERGDAMKRVAGVSWSRNLSGQLDYLWIELNSSSYKTSLLDKLKAVPNTESGCKSSADMFVRQFERPADVDRKSIERQFTAVEYFKKIVIVSASPYAPNSSQNLVTQSGQVANVVRTIDIPVTVRQSGIIRNYTNYSQFYGRWTRGTVQRTLSEIWGNQGKLHSRNVATINNYYLIAMSPKFGSAGDIVTIELADGDNINAILGDSKGADAQSPWGHVMSNGGVDIIEWEAIGNGQQGATRIDLGSWEGQKVTKVHNRGTFLR